MVITGISRGISQLQILLRQEKDPPKRDWSHPKNSLAHSLRSCRRCFFEDCVFLEDCETFFNLAGGIYLKQNVPFQMAQVPPCLRIRRSVSCLFWSTIPARLCWLFEAVLRNIPRNLILGVFIRMALICSSEYVSELSQGLTGVLSVLFCFLPWLDS